MQKAVQSLISLFLFIMVFSLFPVNGIQAMNPQKGNQTTLSLASALLNESDSIEPKIQNEMTATSEEVGNSKEAGSKIREGAENADEEWLGKELTSKVSEFYGYLPLITAILGFLAILALLAILWNIKLHQLVAERTRELKSSVSSTPP